MRFYTCKFCVRKSQSRVSRARRLEIVPYGILSSHFSIRIHHMMTMSAIRAFGRYDRTGEERRTMLQYVVFEFRPSPKRQSGTARFSFMYRHEPLLFQTVGLSCIHMMRTEDVPCVLSNDRIDSHIIGSHDRHRVYQRILLIITGCGATSGRAELSHRKSVSLSECVVRYESDLNGSNRNHRRGRRSARTRKLTFRPLCYCELPLGQHSGPTSIE